MALNHKKYKGMGPVKAQQFAGEGIHNDAELAKLRLTPDELKRLATKTNVAPTLLEEWSEHASPAPAQGRDVRPSHDISPWVKVGGGVLAVLAIVIPTTLGHISSVNDARTQGYNQALNDYNVHTARLDSQLEIARKRHAEVVKQLAGSTANIQVLTTAAESATRNQTDLESRLALATTQLEAAETQLSAANKSGLKNQLELDGMTERLVQMRRYLQAGVKMPRHLWDDEHMRTIAGPDPRIAQLTAPGSTWPLRLEVMQRLFEDGSPEMLPVLVSWAAESSTPISIRSTIADRLETYAVADEEASQRALECLVNLLQDSSTLVRGLAVTSLRRWPNNRVAAAALEAFIDDPMKGWDNKGAAATALSYIAERSSVRVLMAAIDRATAAHLAPSETALTAKHTKEFILAAITSLAKLAADESLPALVKLGQRLDLPSRIRGSAITAIHYLPAARTNSLAEQLILGALASKDHDVFGTAITSAGELGYRSALKPLLAIARDVEALERFRAVAITSIHRVALRTSDSLTAAEVDMTAATLLEVLASDSDTIRGGAITSLGMLRLERAVPALRAILLDDAQSTRVRSASAASLSMIGGGPAVDALLVALRTPKIPDAALRSALVATAIIGNQECGIAVVELIAAGKRVELAAHLGSAIQSVCLRVADDANSPLRKAIEQCIRSLPESMSRSFENVVFGAAALQDKDLESDFLDVLCDDKQDEATRFAAGLGLNNMGVMLGHDQRQRIIKLILARSAQGENGRKNELAKLLIRLLADGCTESAWENAMDQIPDLAWRKFAKQVWSDKDNTPWARNLFDEAAKTISARIAELRSPENRSKDDEPR